MRKKIVIAGLVVLIIGIVLFGIAESSLINKVTISDNWKEYKNGIYISNELNFTSTYIVSYSYNENLTGIIKSSQLNELNLSNYNSISIKPTTVTLKTLSYELSNGSYYIFIISNITPTIKYEYLNVNNVILPALTSFLGIILGIAGFITLIVGLILKKQVNKDKT